MARFRILCLHGQGVNARIFSEQTEALRAFLPSQYEFIFRDAPFVCGPAPGGIAKMYPKDTYRCWYTSPSTERVRAAHKAIIKIIKELGGVDGVMGFSQGAAVAASLILHRQLVNEIPLFRVAIFICSPVPFSRSLDYGIDTRKYFGLIGGGVPIPAPPRLNCPDTVPSHLVTDVHYLNGEEEIEDELIITKMQERREASYNVGQRTGTYYQMFHPSVDEVRIEIPTANIFGRRDAWRLHSMDLMRLCDPLMTTTMEHAGGHIVPQNQAEIEEMCDVIETAIASC